MTRLFLWAKTRIRRYTDEKIIPYIFTLADGPLLFRDLLKTNKMYQDGLKLEGKIPGFKMSVGRSRHNTHFVFAFIVLVFPL